MEESGICDAFFPTVQNGMPSLFKESFAPFPVSIAPDDLDDRTCYKDC
jgi:hypothetical protein